MLLMAPPMFAAVAMVVFSCLWSPYSTTVAAVTAGTESCEQIPDLAKYLNRTATIYKGDGRGTRYIATNHKTGTLLAQCLCKLVVKHKSQKCHTGGFPLQEQQMQHSDGVGMTTTNFAVNMVRNPFVMVHSGTQYHSTTTNKREGWLFHAPAPLKNGLPEALAAYQAWCKPGKTPVDTSQNYQTILKVRWWVGACVVLVPPRYK